MDIALSNSELKEFLDNQRTLIIATTRSTGSPVMHAVWFVYLADAVYINIQRNCFKMNNILRDNRVCALIEDGESYYELRGVTIEGEAEEVKDDDEFLAVQDAQYAKHQRIGSGTERMPSYFEKSREERLLRGDRVLIKIPMTRVRSWDFCKSSKHYQKDNN